MKKITLEMLEIYKPISGLDWLNYKLVRKDMTYHHIQKRENHGKTTIENGALLMPVSHQYLHLIECLDIETYARLNEMFKIVNKQKQEPTREQREIIEFILRSFESIHRWDKGNGGKILVKKKYLGREFEL